MNVPFVDLTAQYQSIRPEITLAIQKVIDENAYIKGRFAKEFEEKFAEFLSARHCIGVGNGTDAITIALKALGIGPGDEVIVPANSFVASSEAVSNAGASVVFVDVDPDYYTMDPRLVEAKITTKTKAIMPVHLYGQPADLKSLRQIADKHGLILFQDSAQAHGATIDGEPIAEFGDVLTFSFYPGKNLGAYGDAGAVLCNDENLAKRVNMLSNHGRVDKYDHEFEGFNSRMDGIQGAVLTVKLKYLDQWTESRIRNAALYDQLLGNIEGVEIPRVQKGMRHVYHLYVIRTSERARLQQFLKENGVATGIHYPIALPNLTAYNHLNCRAEDYPVSSKYQDEVLSLPMYAELTEEMIEYVSECIRKFFGP